MDRKNHLLEFAGGFVIQIPRFQANSLNKFMGAHLSNHFNSPFSASNRSSFYIVNLGTYFSIFHNSRNLASFSLQFWIIKRILQPLITYGIITIIKIKIPLFVQTPCTNPLLSVWKDLNIPLKYCTHTIKGRS